VTVGKPSRKEKDPISRLLKVLLLRSAGETDPLPYLPPVNLARSEIRSTGSFRTLRRNVPVPGSWGPQIKHAAI